MFKAGDKVRCIEDDYGILKLDEIYTVEKCEEGHLHAPGNGVLLKECRNNSCDGWYKIERFVFVGDGVVIDDNNLLLIL